MKAIYDRSIVECELPRKWKEGVCVPIPKINSPQANKVRIITPLTYKNYRILVFDSVRTLSEPLFGDRQHVFRKDCSAPTAFLQITDKATQSYDNLDFSPYAIMSFDLFKAFDKVNHSILLKKLTGKGLTTRFVQWIRSYLSNRSFHVKFQDAYSRNLITQVGVPQGSLLGPAIFCVIVGDFSCVHTQSCLTQYADDYTIVTGSPTLDPLAIRSIICDETNNFMTWCELNNQQHYTDKPQLLIFARSSISYEQAPLPIWRERVY